LAALQPRHGGGTATIYGRGRPRAHSARGGADTGPGARRHRDLVPLDSAARAALGPRRPVPRLLLHPLAGTSRGRLRPPADPHLVSHRRGAAPPQGRAGDRHRPGRRGEKN
jgi:hypothetical protein